ncbi:MAG: hypothetical protein ACMVP2_14345 [Imperialibacter sp.]|uniref:hypothetical protein n=1 Tax=Imperialibacter sp. TaxID=2038411 RepID=UPI003A846D87
MSICLAEQISVQTVAWFRGENFEYIDGIVLFSNYFPIFGTHQDFGGSADMKERVIYIVFSILCSTASAQYSAYEWVVGAGVSHHLISGDDKYDTGSGFRVDNSEKQTRAGLSGGKMVSHNWLLYGFLNQDWAGSEYVQRQYNGGAVRYSSKSHENQTVFGMGVARYFYMKDSLFFFKLNGGLNFGAGRGSHEIRGSTFYDGNWDFRSRSYYAQANPSVGFFIRKRFVFEVYFLSATFGYFDVKAVSGLGGGFVPLDTPTNRYYRTDVKFDGSSLAFAISYLFQPR